MELENELLRLLNESRGSILEDAELFNTLQISKATSQAVKKSLEVSETTEVEIDLAREVNKTEMIVYLWLTFDRIQYFFRTFSIYPKIVYSLRR